MARAYEYITKYTSPNQNARNRKISGITCHWWARPSGQNPLGIVSWLCDKRAGTSAHYVVSEGTVWCIVDPDRRAWHAGDSVANHTQIGIELDPNQSRRAETEKTAAALIADLRAVYGDLPLSPHNRWTSTQCPGNWDLGRLDRLARGVKPGIPVGGGTSIPAPSRPVRDPWESSPRVQGMTGAEVRKVQQALADRGYDLGKWGVDGKYGEATCNAVREAQKDLGVAVDGIAGPDTMNALTGAQKPAQKPSGPNLDVDGRFGHASVRALQEWLNEDHDAGLVVDGKAGKKTWRALQKALGTPVDGEVSNQSYRASELGNGITQGWDYDGRGARGSTMVRALQKRVGVKVDGIWFEGTTRAVQQALNAGGM